MSSAGLVAALADRYRIERELRGDALKVGQGRPLFANRFAPLSYPVPYDVAPDGSWFVFVGANDTPLSAGLRVVLNWFDQPWKS